MYLSPTARFYGNFGSMLIGLCVTDDRCLDFCYQVGDDGFKSAGRVPLGKTVIYPMDLILMIIGVQVCDESMSPSKGRLIQFEFTGGECWSDDRMYRPSFVFDVSIPVSQMKVNYRWVPPWKHSREREAFINFLRSGDRTRDATDFYLLGPTRRCIPFVPSRTL